MKYPLLGKVMALGAVVGVLLIGLESIGGIVRERQQRQREAEQSVVDGLAGSQTVLGPALRRSCTETWDVVTGEGKDRKTLTDRREFVVGAWPRSLNVTADSRVQARYRGLFKLNGFLAKTRLVADWTDLAALQPSPEHAGGRIACEAPVVAVALSDARGIQSASIQAGTDALTVLPGSAWTARPGGFHAVLPALRFAADESLHLEIALELAGTESVAWVPVGGDTHVQLTSDWPHPSFGGRFLPVRREVTTDGFQSQWQVSALATTARQVALTDAAMCRLGGDLDDAAPAKGACLDSFGVGFIDPVNAYVLGDRALKYGLLFIVLTFVAVALVEVMRRVRVHPVQYLLVGCALTVFFLLLVSLGEHLAFGWAYACSAAACTALLSFYAAYILDGLRPGLAFGAGIALLFGSLYALLQLEQTALVLGSLLLFAILAAVMVITRRVDWYALSVQMREAAGRAVMVPVPGEAGGAEA